MSGFDNEVVVSIGERLQTSTAQAIGIMQSLSTDISRINFTGNPQGNVSANPGSISHDPVAGNIYYKQTGTGNTGWLQLNSGYQSFIGPPVDLKVLGSTSLFTPLADFVVVQINTVGINLSGTIGTPSANFGSNNPTYDNIVNGFQSFALTTGGASGSTFGTGFGPGIVIPAGQIIKINVTITDSTATTNTQKPVLIGHYVF